MDGTVRLWSVNDGRLLNTLKAGGDVVTFSPDGSILATCDLKKIQLWRVSDYKLLRSLTSTDETDFLNGVAFSPNGQFLAASNGGAAILWRVSDGTVLRTFGSEGGLSVAFSTDGQVLFMGGKGIKRWRVSDGKLLGILAGDKEYSPFDLDPLGQTLAAGGYARIDLLRADDGKLLCTLDKGMAGETERLLFSPDGNVLVSSNYGDEAESDEKIRLWQVNECRQIQTIPKSAGSYYDFAFSPDGKLLAIGGSQFRGKASYGIIRLFQVNDAITKNQVTTSESIRVQESGTDACTFCGVWEYEDYGSKRYLKISQAGAGKFKLIEGGEYEKGGEIIWFEVGDIYLKLINGRLTATFVSINFRPTHGHEFTYKITCELKSNNKLHYSVSIKGRAEIDKHEATKISN
jgi:WD40 repeat protein